MAHWLGIFGLGRPTGIGLPSEAAGLIGTPEWSRRVRGTPWYPGEAISVSIGQGPVLATVLQLARGFAVLANGGRLISPHLVTQPPGDRIEPMVNHEHLALVTSALEQVVHGPAGTAPAAALEGSAAARFGAALDLLQDGDYAAAYRGWGRRYPGRGYGGMFRLWLGDPRRGECARHCRRCRAS